MLKVKRQKKRRRLHLGHLPDDHLALSSRGRGFLGGEGGACKKINFYRLSRAIYVEIRAHRSLRLIPNQLQSKSTGLVEGIRMMTASMCARVCVWGWWWGTGGVLRLGLLFESSWWRTDNASVHPPNIVKLEP